MVCQESVSTIYAAQNEGETTKYVNEPGQSSTALKKRTTNNPNDSNDEWIDQEVLDEELHLDRHSKNENRSKRRRPFLLFESFDSFVVFFVFNSKQPVRAIEGGDAVRFGHGRVVERRVDEIHQRVIRRGLRHDRLADVNDLCGIGAEAMDPQDLQRLAMKQNLQHPRGLAGNLGSRQAAEQGMPHLVGDAGFRQLALAL